MKELILGDLRLPKAELLSTLQSMVHWAVFVTPLFEKKRFDTLFYLLLVPETMTRAWVSGSGSCCSVVVVEKRKL
jgi:hypothetical protein